MKTKYFHLTAIVLLLFLFLGSVPESFAQSSRVWSDPVNLSNSGAASNPAFVTDTSGMMHAIWIDQFEGYMHSQNANGTEWTSPERVNFPFSVEASLPVLVPGLNGDIFILWQDLNNSLLFAQADSINFGNPSAWNSQQQMAKNTLAFDIAVDNQGAVHLAYITSTDSALGPAGVYYVQSQDDGSSWSAPKLLYESQYFRTVSADVAHVQVVTSSDPDGKKVYVAWDNTTLKRVFMSASDDSGSNWADVVQLKGPEDTGGYNTPYNVHMSITGEKTLLIWEVGEPGSSRCALYGQWSTDGETSWRDPEVVLNDRSICPLGVDLFVQENGTFVVLLSYLQGNPSLMAWNGTEWSKPQVQDELSYFANPVTNETIVLGCQYNFVSDNQLFLIGCDQGSGGDIWITSRPMVPIGDWIFPESLWTLPTQFISAPQKIPFFVYIPDGEYLHTLWAQSPMMGTSNLKGGIYYSGWDGSQWSPAQPIITGTNGSAGKFSAFLNKQQSRLLLVWSSEENGNLLFSWANSSRVNIASEWEAPRNLPSPSQWTSSPDILADSSGRIVVVYAVPFNENRGIYIVQSADNGITWSEPIEIFDGASAGWEMVNYPKIAMSGDGRLHVLFNRIAGLENHPGALYYSQSVDGGATWNDPQTVSEGSVVWSEIVSYDGQTIHRLWQVDDKSVVANLHQVSQDGGTSWGEPNYITGVSDTTMPVTLAVNDNGELDMIQLVTEDSPRHLKEYNLRIEDWRWNGSKWDKQPFQTFDIKGEKADFSIAAGIASSGFVSVSVITTYYDLNGDLKNEIYNIDRSLNTLSLTGTPFVSIIPTLGNAPALTQLPSAQSPQLSVEPTINPALVEAAPSALSRNLVGIFWVVIVLGLVLFVTLRKTGPKGQNKRSD